MYVNTEYNPTVNINLENGIYTFDAESATGKTRLCKHLKKLKAYGEAVDSFTYDDLLRGDTLDKVLKAENKVIMLDRYELYKSEGHELINQCSAKSIILIDCKSAFLGSSDSEDCSIVMTEDSLEVFV